MKLTINHIIQRNPDILASKMDEEIVMMSISRGEYYGFDPIGSRIWNLLENPVSVQDIVNTLLDEFEIDRDSCLHDVMQFLEEILDKDLVRAGN